MATEPSDLDPGSCSECAEEPCLADSALVPEGVFELCGIGAVNKYIVVIFQGHFNMSDLLSGRTRLFATVSFM